MARTPTQRRLRRLRGLLVFLAASTALLVAAAARLDSVARGAAAVAALACVIAWLVVLEAEGRVADRLEHRVPRRRLAHARKTQRPAPRRDAARRAA